MISQPSVQTTGAPSASASVPVQQKWGVWAGVKVALRDGFIPFLQSWHPGYEPLGWQSSAQPDGGLAFSIGSPDGPESGFFQGVALGARLVSSYAELPAEISSMLEGVVTFSSATRLRDLFGGFGATKDTAPGQGRVDSPVYGSATNDKGRRKKKPQQTPQPTSLPATASVGLGQLPKAAVVLGVLSGLTAGANAFPSGSKEGWKPVPDAKTLGKFGRDARSAGYSAGVAGEPRTAPATPAPVPTVANTAMNFTSLPGTALPTRAATPAASTGGIVGIIVLGSTLAIVLAGVRIYYLHYHRRSSPAVAGGLMELETINTAGQAQEEVYQPMIEAVKRESELAGERHSRIAPSKPPRPTKSALPKKPALLEKSELPRRSAQPKKPPLPERTTQPEKTAIPKRSAQPEKPALLEKPPLRPRNPFFQKPGEQVMPRHENKYEDVGVYEDVGN
ncbi:hypothetical protein [Endozoicomonas sp. ONNA2]|uniref:hypothetical protein n=1 Tax=Endozoicomonas sp. ONNA2 TaxID=2828741 RepID=UPI0021493A44|nr:hypothetical protein [Endozoicomonas sp. ONNA2]